MKRIKSVERPDWRQTAEGLGFVFHTFDGEPYWDETAYYQFSLKQIENDLEDPSEAIHELCMDLVGAAVRDEELLKKLAIPESHWDYVRDSWLSGQRHLYGRLDLGYDGTGPAKLYEMNYDTPTSLYESAFFQWLWLEQMKARGALHPDADQFNLLQDLLVDALRTMDIPTPFYLSSVRESLEDRGTVAYLEDVAAQAGLPSRYIAIEDIGLNEAGQFTDLDDRVIPSLFKLYPWEFMLQEEFGAALAKSGTRFIEPPWKAILSNKGALALLWERHPNHPNLLPTFFDENPNQALSAGWVRKPLFSREGANIELVDNRGERLFVDGPYTDAPYIRQAFHALPRFENNYTLIGSWIVADRAAGIGLREDDSLITKDSSRFLPHIILD